MHGLPNLKIIFLYLRKTYGYSVFHLSNQEKKKYAVPRVARHFDGNTVADNGHLISNTDTTEPLLHNNIYSDYIHNQL